MRAEPRAPQRREGQERRCFRRVGGAAVESRAFSSEPRGFADACNRAATAATAATELLQTVAAESRGFADTATAAARESGAFRDAASVESRA